jgi:hypothetical protein
MAITTLDGYIASTKQIIQYSRPTAITATSFGRSSIYQSTGVPGTGVLAGTDTTSGVLVTSSTAGFPLINTTSGSYYLTRIGMASNVASNITIQDLIYKAGAYNFNANTTLSSQPSISSRVPGGTDYTNVSIWFEAVTAFTGTPTITITYTNQSGVTGRSTGAFSLGVAPIVGRLVQIPLQAGDTGVQKIESIVGTVATAGTFNIQLVRDIFTFRVNVANMNQTFGLDSTGMSEIFQTSALNVVVQPDAASTGIIGGYLEVASG